MRALRLFAPFRRKGAPGYDIDDTALEATGLPSSREMPSRSGQSFSNTRDGADEQSVASSTLPTASTLSSVSGVRTLPRPALKWLGPAGRVALREFDFASDADTVCSWQQETYSLNFVDFHYTDSFAAAFRHDLRRAALDPHHGLFVLDEGELVGFMWLVICENTWTRERYGYVNNLYITGARRKSGLARELVHHADTWFRGHRIKRARLTVTVANSQACRLYEGCGYEIARWEMEKEL